VLASETELLGAPLFPGTALESAWSKRCDELARALDRLALINAQDALVILRASFSAPRVQHLLRCSPLVNNSSLQIFDDLLRSAVSRDSNSALSDTQWLQASLPIKQGENGDFARNSSFSSVSGKHSFSPGTNPIITHLFERLIFRLLPHRLVYIIWYASRSIAKQTVFLGPTKPTSQLLSRQSIYGWAITDGTVFSFRGATYWWLVAIIAHR